MPQFPGLHPHDALPGVTGIHHITPDPDHPQQRGSTTPLSSSTPALTGNNNGVTMSSSSAVSPDIPMQHGAAGVSNDADIHHQHQAQPLQHSLNHPASPNDPVHSLAHHHHHHHHALSEDDVASVSVAHITANVTTEAVPAEVTPSEVMSSVRGVDILRNNGNSIGNDDDEDDERRAAAVAALLAQRSPFGPPRALPLISTTAPIASSAMPPTSLHHNHHVSSIVSPAGVALTSSPNAVVLHNATAESLGNSHHQSLHSSQTQNHPASSSLSTVAGSVAAFLPPRSDHSPITPTEGSQTPFITPEGGNVALNRPLGPSTHEPDAMSIDSMNFNAIRVHKEADGDNLTSAEEVDHNSMDTD